METKQRTREKRSQPGTAASGSNQPRQQRPQGEQPRQQRPQGEQPRQRQQSKEGAQKRSAGKEAAQRQRNANGPRSRDRGETTDLSTKKRAYGNSKPKRKSTLTVMSEAVASNVQRHREKSKERRRTKGNGQKRSMPTVIYNEPKVFNGSRALIQLVTVTAIVAAFVMGLSLYFKVESITVSGAKAHSAYDVKMKSGITEGDSLLTFSRARAAAKIKAELPYVKEVRFGIKLPNTVNIIIEEDDVVYAIQDSTSIWWLISSEGRVVEQAQGRASNYTKIVGVTLENPTAGERAVAVEATPSGTDENGQPIPVTVTGSQKLRAALEIVSALEDNDIVGEAASVDVTRIEDIILWYGTRYQVDLGNTDRLSYKIACMNDVILQLSEYQSGILDISFTIWPDQVGYTPFS